MPLSVTHATVDVADVREPAQNPNHMSEADFAALRAGIRTQGALQPPLLRRIHPLGAGPQEGPTWELVDGVHRVRAMVAEGITSFQAVCTDADEKAARILQVALNKVRGELNLTAVAETVRALIEADIEMPDLELMGYREDELRAMMEATSTETAEDVLAGGAGGMFEDPEPEKAPKPYILELTFSTAAELRKVKRTLKKAGSGDHAAGLLRLIEGA